MYDAERECHLFGPAGMDQAKPFSTTICFSVEELELIFFLNLAGDEAGFLKAALTPSKKKRKKKFLAKLF